MLTKQVREMERQATVTQTRVQRFIELQNKINQQIDQYGEADIQLVGELDLLGDSLTGNEVNELMMHYENDGVIEYNEYEDDEWMMGE